MYIIENGRVRCSCGIHKLLYMFFFFFCFNCIIYNFIYSLVVDVYTNTNNDDLTISEIKSVWAEAQSWHNSGYFAYKYLFLSFSVNIDASPPNVHSNWNCLFTTQRPKCLFICYEYHFIAFARFLLCSPLSEWAKRVLNMGVFISKNKNCFDRLNCV